MYVLKLVFSLLLVAAPALADEARVAVAANFRAPMQMLQARFEAETGHVLTMSFGATGQLYAQIVNGAPFDAFLSADQARPLALLEGGAAVPGTQFTYATGRLYLLLRQAPVADASPPDLSGIRRVSIANPRTAPYGAAAEQVLSRLTFPDGSPLIAQAQSVSGVNAAVSAKAVDAGFAAYASVASLGDLPPGWLVPGDLHDPIRQDAVLLTRGSDNAAALAFMKWLRGETARTLIREHGYHVD